MKESAPAQIIENIYIPIQAYTRTFLVAPATDKYGVNLGFATGSQFWVVGRAGVLGSCPVQIAVAAIAFEPAAAVARAWAGVPKPLSHQEVAGKYRDLMVAWGERALLATDPELLHTVDELGRRIIQSAPSALGVLFAGWRELAQPDSLPGRAALTLHVLRELRGAAHIAAILAYSLTPLDAILAAPHPPPRTGPAYAERMGYTGPFRNPEEIREQRLAAERLTCAMLEPFFSVLSPAELRQFGTAVPAIHPAT